MTQILTAVTEDYVLLASDRRLTQGNGRDRGKLIDDDTCKLVSLCNTCGIGYSGLAQLDGKPTYEWIAAMLAAEGCNHPAHASLLLSQHATRAVAQFPPELRRQYFVIAGWGEFKQFGIRPFFTIVSNMLTLTGKPLSEPADHFYSVLRLLLPGKELMGNVTGEPLSMSRAKTLSRNLRRLISKEIGPKEAQRLLVEEIIYTSTKEGRPTVGSKILSVCIPKGTLDSFLRTRGGSLAIATPATERTPTFAYFEPGYQDLKQFGPAFTCGGTAWSDFTAERRGKGISVSMKYLGGRTLKQ